MVRIEEDKPLNNKDSRNEQDKDYLLNYEFDEDDDGFDWET